jgi:hypothetical protein
MTLFFFYALCKQPTVTQVSDRSHPLTLVVSIDMPRHVVNIEQLAYMLQDLRVHAILQQRSLPLIFLMVNFLPVFFPYLVA